MNKGILLVNKAAGCSSFHIVAQLRKRLRIEKIGHAGTLDPFATGVMVLLVGQEFTRRSSEFIADDKEYRAEICLGVETDSYDKDGMVTNRSDYVPTLEEIQAALGTFQGRVSQIPPMFSAKKVGGQKLYDLARKGIEIERQPVIVELKTTLIRYEYPRVELEIACSKGTYIRTIAHDLGRLLGCGAHVSTLVRTRSGVYRLDECMPQEKIVCPDFDLQPYFRS